MVSIVRGLVLIESRSKKFTENMIFEASFINFNRGSEGVESLLPHQTLTSG